MSDDDIRKDYLKKDLFADLCGIDQFHGDQGRSVVTMPLDDQHRNAMGTAHGGAVFMLVDMAFAAATFSLGLLCVNAQTSISYLAPGITSPLRGEAEPVKLGRTLVTFNVSIYDGANTRIANALVTGYVKKRFEV